MKKTANLNDMVYHQDVRRLSVGSVEEYWDWMKAHPNVTQYTVIWCTSSYDIYYNDVSFPCTYGPENQA